ATAAHGRVGALADLDGFHREDFPGLRAGVAHAVQVGAALRIETANEGTVALRVAALTGTHGDARHGAQRIVQAQGIGILEDLLRSDGDRAGRVDQRRRVLRGLRPLDLVRLALGGVLYLDGRQFPGVVV